MQNSDEDRNRMIDMDIADIVMEKPYGFSVAGRRFYLYPTTLGKNYLIGRLICDLGFDEIRLAMSEHAEVLRIAQQKPKELCRILAYHTFNTKKELFDERQINARTDFFASHIDAEDMALLFYMTLTREDLSAATKRLGIDAERKRQERALKAKKKDVNTFTFGGKSIVGALIVPACEKLNMTPEQVVWGISYQFLQLLMADSITQIYLTDEERKKARLSDEPVINGDDPANWAKIRAQKWD